MLSAGTRGTSTSRNPSCVTSRQMATPRPPDFSLSTGSICPGPTGPPTRMWHRALTQQVQINLTDLHGACTLQFPTAGVTSGVTDNISSALTFSPVSLPKSWQFLPFLYFFHLLRPNFLSLDPTTCLPAGSPIPLDPNNPVSKYKLDHVTHSLKQTFQVLSFAPKTNLAPSSTVSATPIRPHIEPPPFPAPNPLLFLSHLLSSSLLPV